MQAEPFTNESSTLNTPSLDYALTVGLDTYIDIDYLTYFCRRLVIKW